jgi:hypothetical protein
MWIAQSLHGVTPVGGEQQALVKTLSNAVTHLLPSAAVGTAFYGLQSLGVPQEWLHKAAAVYVGLMTAAYTGSRELLRHVQDLLKQLAAMAKELPAQAREQIVKPFLAVMNQGLAAVRQYIQPVAATRPETVTPVTAPTAPVTAPPVAVTPAVPIASPPPLKRSPETGNPGVLQSRLAQYVAQTASVKAPTSKEPKNHSVAR